VAGRTEHRHAGQCADRLGAGMVNRASDPGLNRLPPRGRGSEGAGPLVQRHPGLLANILFRGKHNCGGIYLQREVFGCLSSPGSDEEAVAHSKRIDRSAQNLINVLKPKRFKGVRSCLGRKRQVDVSLVVDPLKPIQAGSGRQQRFATLWIWRTRLLNGDRKTASDILDSGSQGSRNIPIRFGRCLRTRSLTETQPSA